MNPHPTPQHLSAFVAHTIASLPDSLRLRKTVLVTALDLLPRHAETERHQLKELLTHLHNHESSQLEFASVLNPETKTQIEPS